MKASAIAQFVQNIERILAGEQVDVFASLLSCHFEYIAAEILTSKLSPGIWYDGANDLEYEVLSPNQVEFRGNMSVWMYQDKTWTEPFVARVTDNRTNSEGMPIYIRMGQHEDKQDLFQIQWLYNNY